MRKVLVSVGLVLGISLIGVLASPSGSQATTFNPFFGPTDFYRLDPLTPGANPDVHAQFNITAPSANVSGLFAREITFGDADVVTADAAGIPGTGAYVGSVSSTLILGIANESCNTLTPVTFNFAEAGVSTTTRPFTHGGAMIVGAGGIPPAADDALTDFNYVHAGALDPLGLKLGTDVAGLGTAPEGTIRAAANEIRVDFEEMLVVGVDAGTNQYRVVRGWNNTTPAQHAVNAAVTRVAVIYPNGPSTNLLANLAEDDGDLDNNGVPEEAAGPPGGAQFNGNQVADGADAVPSFVRDSLIPSVNPDDATAVTARDRYFGVAVVAGLILVLQSVIMDPAALAAFPNLSWAQAPWGYPSVTFLQDPLGPRSNSAVTDLCNFTSNTFLFGITHDNACTGAVPPPTCTGSTGGFTLRLAVDGGCPGATTPNECGSARSTNPATAQRVRYYQYAVSQRDYDNDLFQQANELDSCPYHLNPIPIPPGVDDTDGDGLGNPCDPTPGVANLDHDGDGWQNRPDNCATVANVAALMLTPNQNQFDQDTSPGVNVYDGGPNTDSIGPECDVAGSSCGGCPILTPTGANGHYHAAYAAQTLCIGAANDDCSDTIDTDGDGVVNGRDTCRVGANAPTRFPDAAPPGGTEPGSAVISAVVDPDTITLDSAAGFTSGSTVVIDSPLETLRYITSIVGNNLNLNAAIGMHDIGDPVAQVSFAQNLRDLNNSGFVDTGDIAQLTGGAFGKTGGDPALPAGYQARLDINLGPPSNTIDTADVAQVTGLFGRACGPP
jgi:hypothetical protein